MVKFSEMKSTRLIRILRIIDNYFTPVACEHEEAKLEFRVCGLYKTNQEKALKCYEGMHKGPEFIRLKGKDYLKCPKPFRA